MVEVQNSFLEDQESVLLKIEEPKVDSANPWIDDLLNRYPIAARLTNLVKTQEPPLTVSLHGQWGTGKTFLLKRWRQELENAGHKAIYFNAWEDDFNEDPLLSILGQLSESFGEGLFKDSLHKVTEIAGPLILSNASSLLNRFTGLTPEFTRDLPSGSDLIKEYLRHHRTKDQLRGNLEELSTRVRNESCHPLVFIIDELDRCRPPFAIELLERVKHIFDVPNMVFVFGLNRNELCKSLASVYGDIQTGVYLRRFFDFEFNLPTSDSQAFALHLIDRFQIVNAFKNLPRAIGRGEPMWDYDNYRRVFPGVWGALGLSLRDIDYGIRLLALLARSLPGGIFTHPYLLALLIGMKFKKPEFYSDLINGNFRASNIMDFIDNIVQENSPTENVTAHFDRIEGFLYCADNTNPIDQRRGENAWTELQRLRQGDVESGFQVISQRAQAADPEQISRIIRGIEANNQLGITDKVFSQLAELIDVHRTELRY